LAVHKENENFSKPVSEFMTSNVSTLSPTDSIDTLVPLFKEDKVAIVIDNDGSFLGLVTKIDLIHHLRKQLPR
ncbi:MAG: CBS domain-containing protein, partial [Phycisphaerales bacterium]|nr:CBS domain-containing protein [Phycisphaerales bacterium]